MYLLSRLVLVLLYCDCYKECQLLDETTMFEFMIDECVCVCAGMMGSGKSTVGKIMSEVLGYSFFDRSVSFCESKLAIC